jgi:hypothetical protein
VARARRARDIAQVLKHLPSKDKALSSSPSTTPYKIYINTYKNVFREKN